MMMQTTTQVHSQDENARMLHKNAQRETSAALAVSMYAQLLCMSALRLLPIASTASWIALICAVPAAGGVYLLSAFAVKRMRGESAVLRIASAGFALLFLSDMALSLFALTELVSAYVLPGAHRVLLTLAVVLPVPFLMGGRAHGGAARAACLLRGFFLLAVVVCFFFALPGGNAGFLYPLLGYGAGQTARGAAYMTGGMWSVAALPLLAHERGEPLKKSLRTAVHPLLALFMMAAVLFSYACLLPSPLLPGDWGYVLRLQLLMEMSPNTLAWSLMLISRMLLFLTAFAAAGDFSRKLLCHAFRRQRVPLWPLALLCVPLSLWGAARAEKLLAYALPLRFLLAIALAALLLFARGKKETA